jgi:hypothetical protein
MILFGISVFAQNKMNTDDSLVKLPDKIDDLQSVKLLVFICLAVFVPSIATIIVWNKLQFNRFSEKIRKEFASTKQIVGNDINSNDINSNDRIIEDKLNKLERQFGELFNKLERQLGELSEKVRSEIQSKSNQPTQPQTNNALQLIVNNSTKDNDVYFASKSEKQLTEQLPNSANASFKVYAANDNEAKFDYIGAVRNENWFEGICTIENAANDNLSDKKQINTINPGKVKKENNNWIVTTPAKIKFV